MGLAQPPGLYRQREQPPKALSALGTGQGTLQVTAEPRGFCAALGFPRCPSVPGLAMPLSGRKGEETGRCRGTLSQKRGRFSVTEEIARD